MQHTLLLGIPTWLRARRRNLPVLLAIALLTLFTFYSFLEPASSRRPISHVTTSQHHGSGGQHPIDDLIRQGELEFASLLAEQSHDLSSAAEKYRTRRKRHPPPGFDKWFEFARKNDAIIVEEFFDQIYHDIAPFWSLSPQWTSLQARKFEHVISVRRGKASFKTDKVKRVPWVPLWFDMVQGIAQYLPDVDMPVNVMDESRVLVPHEKMKTLVDAELQSRRMQPPDTVSSEFTGVPGGSKERYDPHWVLNGPYWEMFRHTCPPESPASNITAITDFSDLPEIDQASPKYSYYGFVQNWTVARNPCHYPQLRELHGSFIEPTSMATTQELIPLFGGSKLQQNNEILIPGTAYWSKDANYDLEAGSWTDWFDAFSWSSEKKWSRKATRFFWRGPAAGGRNRKENWTHFHRHRFAQMLNGSAVQGAEFAADPRLQTTNMVSPNQNPYNLSSLAAGGNQKTTGALSALGEWLTYYADAAFTHLVCFPHEAATDTWKVTCPYSSPFFKVKSRIPMRSTLSSKYLPDLDGNSYSGRWLALLRSSALPIKATIYSEWHDYRLIPWVHFVPLDNTFVDLYGVMEYFLGFENKGGHDEVAEKMAMQGKMWAARTLRKVDMRIYVWRLLLEFARVCDSERDRLGWVQDLLKE